jgi:acyl-CoA thioesterase
VTPEELARACADAMWADDHASRGLGISLDHVAPNRSRLSMTVTQAMANGHGMCHGGFLFALADSAFAFACNTDNQRRVAAHCSVTYLAPARLGQVLVATAELRAEAGRSGLYDVRVATEAGELIAEFRGLCRSLGQNFFPDTP